MCIPEQVINKALIIKSRQHHIIKTKRRFSHSFTKELGGVYKEEGYSTKSSLILIKEHFLDKVN